MFDAAANAKNASPPPRIFSVGHSNHEPGAFLALLAKYRIREIVDVRSIPSSGRFPHFKKRNLDALLRKSGICYRHCPELGNKVDGIAKLLRKPEGQAALAELAAAARRAAAATFADPDDPATASVIAYMCAEADWRDCHRQVISQLLLEDFGITSIHILRNGSTELHPNDFVLPEHFGVVQKLPRLVDDNRDLCCIPDEPGAKVDEDDLAAAMDALRAVQLAEAEPPPAGIERPLGRTRWRSSGAHQNGCGCEAAGSEERAAVGEAPASADAAPAVSAAPDAVAPARARRWGRHPT